MTFSLLRTGARVAWDQQRREQIVLLSMRMRAMTCSQKGRSVSICITLDRAARRRLEGNDNS